MNSQGITFVSSTPTPPAAPKKRRGFAGMTPERRREICSKGGKAAQARGTAHRYTQAEAREAGRRGGLAVSAIPGHMENIGAKGGRASARRHLHAPVSPPAAAPAAPVALSDSDYGTDR